MSFQTCLSFLILNIREDILKNAGNQLITPVFSVTWFFRNPLICWFAAQETFIIIIMSVEHFLGGFFVKYKKVKKISFVTL